MKVDLGSVSHGTHRLEDLIPAFADKLEELANELEAEGPTREGFVERNLRRYRGLIEDARVWIDSDAAIHDDDDGLLVELSDALEKFSPPFAYFGCHPDDGSDYGFWPLFEEAVADGKLQSVDDLADADRNRGPAVLISDHGNVTLYCPTPEGWTEVWSIV